MFTMLMVTGVFALTVTVGLVPLNFMFSAVRFMVVASPPPDVVVVVVVVVDPLVVDEVGVVGTPLNTKADIATITIIATIAAIIYVFLAAICLVSVKNHDSAP